MAKTPSLNASTRPVRKSTGLGGRLPFTHQITSIKTDLLKPLRICRDRCHPPGRTNPLGTAGTSW